MKVAGTIVEYNPFHNGHLYQLKKIKEISKCDCLVVVMSTYFTMRGDISVHNPYDKCKYALSEADIVIALPATLAVNSAEYFAYYACRELNKVGVTDLYFGSEDNDITKYELLYNNKDIDIKESLKNGESYKRAHNLDILPNDLLGYCYYKAIKDNNYNIKCHTIKRIGSQHGEVSPNDDTYTSSSAIRSNSELLKNYAPHFVSNSFYDYNKLFNYLKYFLLVNKDYENIRFIDEGIHNLIIKNINTSSNFNELLDRCANKRYTKSRIKRAIFHLLINDLRIDDDYPYTKILGFNARGKEYLNTIKKNIKLITNNKNGICNILDNEIIIAKLIDLVYDDNKLKYELNGPVIKGC